MLGGRVTPRSTWGRMNIDEPFLTLGREASVIYFFHKVLTETKLKNLRVFPFLEEDGALRGGLAEWVSLPRSRGVGAVWPGHVILPVACLSAYITDSPWQILSFRCAPVSRLCSGSRSSKDVCKDVW